MKNEICKIERSEEIKEIALSMRARAAGIASVKDINKFAPPGHRPDDILNGAKSVVVIGGNEPTAGAWRAGNNRVLGSIGYNRSLLASIYGLDIPENLLHLPQFLILECKLFG